MKKIVIVLVLIGLSVISAISLLKTGEVRPTRVSELKSQFLEKATARVDHSKFPILQIKAASPRDLTAACLSCHNKTAQEVMQSNHWNWERPEYIAGRGIVYLGKKNVLNNFCIGVDGNEGTCARCHIGFGMRSARTFSYTDSTNIDCLVCHDNTETYAKAPEKGGAPEPVLDLNYIAGRVGSPKRSNCGVCHFYGGGGNNVKHGDLEEALFEPTRDIDIHMAVDGVNLSCIDCHTTERHVISGKMYSLSSMNRNRSHCESCHGEAPHADNILNKHMLKVACQTCHIPIYAKAHATKTHWDWSTAGRLRDGKPYEINDADGNHIYLSTKGSFQWGKNLKPDYIWFNGTAGHYLLGDVIADTSRPILLNTLNGSYHDPDAKIVPVKTHNARQPYDPAHRMLIKAKLYAEEKGQGALWVDFDWHKAAEKGMQALGLPFSGEIAFIRTQMHWRINHMVSGKDQAVACTECHTRADGRLANLTDFYLPGRDRNLLVETAGISLLWISLAGVLLHGSIRIAASRRNSKRG
ncbi:tetrathionate reductase family octaheme c-type cytochrome [candidate division KSB1 bacterium]|nr:tetrathionate reductase family octaheme c-type cytochrome [candidate division KSB1 bacterium]